MLADFEDRTLSQMATILLTEAMDVRDEAAGQGLMSKEKIEALARDWAGEINRGRTL